MLNVLIVDDEALAHDVLLHHCAAHPDVRIVGQCYNAAEALVALSEQPVDLLLLDIRMPRFGGLDLLRGLQAPPMAIVVSAHREYALDGYDLDVVDYLLKPVSAERLAAALDKVRRRLKPALAQDQGDIILKVDRVFRRFRVDSIACIEAEGNFAKVWFDGGNCLATITLRKIEELLPGDRFKRVHKSFVVNLDAVTQFGSRSLCLANGMKVPIGRTYRDAALRPLQG
jgi:DNA-binding LytR/AlgR family response regulator